MVDVSDLETTSNSDEEPEVPSTRSKIAWRKDLKEDCVLEYGEVEYGAWTKTKCFKVVPNLPVTFGYIFSYHFLSISFVFLIH